MNTKGIVPAALAALLTASAIGVPVASAQSIISSISSPAGGLQTYAARAHAQLPPGITMPLQIRNAEKSTNWGGWIDTVRSRRGAFRSVASTFRVPAVNILQTSDGPAGNMVSQWVGLDGSAAGSSTLEQTGVVEWLESDIGVPHYVAWWEMIPAPAVAFGAVEAGDLIRASVQWYGPRVPSGFTMTVVDQTQHQTGRMAAKYNNYTPPRNSSEVITELPSNSKGPMALTNYGNVRYGQSRTSTSNVPHSLASNSSYRAHRVILVDASGSTMANVGPLTHGGTAFSTPFISSGR